MASPSSQDLLELPQPHHELLRNHCPNTNFSSFPYLSLSCNPRQLRNFGLPSVGHTQTQCHLHAAVPALESPSPTTVGDPCPGFPQPQTPRAPKPSPRREAKQETPLGKVSHHISTSWDSTGDTTQTDTETFQRPFPPFPPHPSPKSLFQGLPPSFSLARTRRGAGSLSPGYRWILKENGPSKSPQNPRKSAGCSSAQLEGEEDSGKLNPRHWICSQLRKVEQPARPAPAPRGFRKRLLILKGFGWKRSGSPGLLREWLFTL